MMGEQGKAADGFGASLVAGGGLAEGVPVPRFRYDYELVRADGSRECWSHENLVTTVGKNDLLDKYFSGSAYTAAWFLGLISSVSYGAGPAVGDTAASHAGWTECGATNAPNYASATRPAIGFASAASGSKATSAAVSFTFTNSGTVKGGLVISNNTKAGTTGILYSAGTFADKVVATDDVLNVTLTLSV